MRPREELKDLFDVQINRVIAVMNEQLDRMDEKHPQMQIVESHKYFAGPFLLCN